MRTRAEITQAFTPNTKLTDTQKQICYKLEVAMKDVAEEVFELLPEHADRTVVMRKLLEAKMLAIQLATHYISPMPGAATEPAETKGHGKKKAS